MFKKDGVKELSAFKNQIFIGAVIVALIFEAGSLLFLGLDKGFAYGLALGTSISIVNFNILAFTLKSVLANGNKVMAFVSYFFRLCIYGFTFYVALKSSLASGAGAALGFVAIKISIYYLHGFRGLRRSRKEAAASGKPAARAKPVPWPDEDPDAERPWWKKLLDWPEDEPEERG
ncbi:MAG: ATP synthase subunit I [Clostridiales Family XIII bacterium]|jgi:hypothetical protein|nr:ATP synthase subunit I [Clostridiales Family XIII bacterium]